MQQNRTSLIFNLIICSIAFCSSALADPLNTNSREITPSVHAVYKHCVEVQTEKLDDGVSPADVIGNSVAVSCDLEYRNEMMLIVENDNDAVKRQFMVQAERMKGEGPTRYVLSRRAALRSQKKQSTSSD